MDTFIYILAYLCISISILPPIHSLPVFNTILVVVSDIYKTCKNKNMFVFKHLEIKKAKVEYP